MERIFAGDLKVDIVMRLAELAAVIPDGTVGPADADTVKAAATEIERLRSKPLNEIAVTGAMVTRALDAWFRSDGRGFERSMRAALLAAHAQK